jgi:hypothetical protein
VMVPKLASQAGDCGAAEARNDALDKSDCRAGAPGYLKSGKSELAQLHPRGAVASAGQGQLGI